MAATKIPSADGDHVMTLKSSRTDADMTVFQHSSNFFLLHFTSAPPHYRLLLEFKMFWWKYYWRQTGPIYWFIICVSWYNIKTFILQNKQCKKLVFACVDIHTYIYFFDWSNGIIIKLENMRVWKWHLRNHCQILFNTHIYISANKSIFLIPKTDISICCQ